MNRQKILLCLLSHTLATQPLFAATPFEGQVPIDIARFFFGNAYSSDPSQLFADLPADFPQFSIPPGNEILGSLVQGDVQRVVLRVPQDGEASLYHITNSLLGGGWVELERPELQQSQNGFVSVVPPQLLCHDEFGNMRLYLNTIESETLVNLQLNFTPNRVNGTCADQIAIRQRQAYEVWERRELAQHLPRLEMPQRDNAFSPIIGSGGSGTPNDWETHVILNIDWSISDVFEYFTDQVDAQGWISDARIQGALMATASWAKITEDGRHIIGLLSVVEKDAKSYELRFRLLDRTASNLGNAPNNLIR